MAKKGARNTVALQCTVCNKVNYHTSYNKTNTSKLDLLSKYCKQCRKDVAHKVREKLK